MADHDINTIFGSSGGRVGPWKEFLAGGTYTDVIPVGATAVEYIVMGGGGGGIGGPGGRATGASGAGCSFGKTALTSGASVLTLIVAARGTAASNGNTSSLSDGTLTISATGGQTGTTSSATQPTAGSGSGGENNVSGGQAGSVVASGATGGASPGSPWGAGKNSGSLTGSTTLSSSAGATVFQASAGGSSGTFGGQGVGVSATVTGGAFPSAVLATSWPLQASDVPLVLQSGFPTVGSALTTTTPLPGVGTSGTARTAAILNGHIHGSTSGVCDQNSGNGGATVCGDAGPFAGTGGYFTNDSTLGSITMGKAGNGAGAGGVSDNGQGWTTTKGLGGAGNIAWRYIY